MTTKDPSPATRFAEDRYYRPGDPELDTIASRGTLATWRWQGRGPRYTKYGNRVLYRAPISTLFSTRASSIRRTGRPNTSNAGGSLRSCVVNPARRRGEPCAKKSARPLAERTGRRRDRASVRRPVV